MQIPHQFHPFEILRRIRLFLREFLRDYEIRYPEVRSRKILELRLRYPETSRQVVHELQGLLPPTKIISLLKWPELMEWNERHSGAKAQYLIEEQHAETRTELEAEILDRLWALLRQLQSERLETAPSLWNLLRYRFIYGPPRHESFYLSNRLKTLQGPPTLRVSS